MRKTAPLEPKGAAPTVKPFYAIARREGFRLVKSNGRSLLVRPHEDMRVNFLGMRTLG